MKTFALSPTKNLPKRRESACLPAGRDEPFLKIKKPQYKLRLFKTAHLRRNQKLLPPSPFVKFIVYQRLGAQTWMQALELIPF